MNTDEHRWGYLLVSEIWLFLTQMNADERGLTQMGFLVGVTDLAFLNTKIIETRFLEETGFLKSTK